MSFGFSIPVKNYDYLEKCLMLAPFLHEYFNYYTNVQEVEG